MYLEQLSVFMENKVSRLNEVLLQLKTSKVNVLSLSLADTSEFGVLRLIVDNPEEVEVTEKGEGKNVTIELHVAAGDMGKVIGKQGRIAKAIRSVVKAASSKDNKRVDVEIV